MANFFANITECRWLDRHGWKIIPIAVVFILAHAIAYMIR